MVIHLAARVGGIGYNRRNPALLVRDNLLIGANVFEAARWSGSSAWSRRARCAPTPKRPPCPLREADLWSGYPDSSNAPYGLAKRMLLVLSDGYRHQHGLDSCAPVIANLYGPGDNYDLEDSHVVAAMVRKYVEAVDRGEERVTLWGSGAPRASSSTSTTRPGPSSSRLSEGRPSP